MSSRVPKKPPHGVPTAKNNDVIRKGLSKLGQGERRILAPQEEQRRVITTGPVLPSQRERRGSKPTVSIPSGNYASNIHRAATSHRNSKAQSLETLARNASRHLLASGSNILRHTAASFAHTLVEPTVEERTIPITREQSQNNSNSQDIIGLLKRGTKISELQQSKYYNSGSNIKLTNNILNNRILRNESYSIYLTPLYNTIVKKKNYNFYFSKFSNINIYLEKMIRNTKELRLSLNEKKNKFFKIYSILYYGLTKINEKNSILKPVKNRTEVLNGKRFTPTKALNYLIEKIPSEYKQLPFDDTNMYDNLSYTLRSDLTRGYFEVKIVRIKDIERAQAGQPNKSIMCNVVDSRSKLIKSGINSTTLKPDLVQINTNYGFVLPIGDLQIEIQGGVGITETYILKYYQFDINNCIIRNSSYDITTTIEIPGTRKYNPSLIGEIKKDTLLSSSVHIPNAQFIEHTHAFILNKICRCIDTKVGLNPRSLQCNIEYDETKKCIHFLYENLNTYIKLPDESNATSYNPLLHFYIAIFLYKQLLKYDVNNTIILRNEFINDINSVEYILKHVVLICKRLMKYINFNVSVKQISGSGSGPIKYVSDKIFNCAKDILKLIIGYVCSNSISHDTKEHIDTLIGYNICEVDLYLYITKKILDITIDYNTFKTNIDIIDENNRYQNKYRLYRKVINELIYYYFNNTIHRSDILDSNPLPNLDNILKIHNDYKYYPAENQPLQEPPARGQVVVAQPLVYKSHLWYNYNPSQRTESGMIKPESQPSLNRYNLKQIPNPVRNVKNQQNFPFLNEIFSNPQPISYIKNDKLINDNILAKILYFYYIFNTELKKNRNQDGNLLNISEEEKYFFIDILEYQFYLYHIIRKKYEADTGIVLPGANNYCKAAIILKTISPNIYSVLSNYYNITGNRINNINNINERRNIIFIQELIDSDRKLYNVGKVIEYLRHRDGVVTGFNTDALLGYINDNVQDPFMECYRNLVENESVRRSINGSGNFVNYQFLEVYIQNPIHRENIFCLLNHEHIVNYKDLRPEIESIENKKQKLTNLIKLIPHIIFYYYKYIEFIFLEIQQQSNQVRGNELRNEFVSNIIYFLELVIDVLNAYHFLIENNDYLNYRANKNNINTIFYKINKIIYKTLEDLYDPNRIDEINQIYKGYKDIFERRYVEINQLRTTLLELYEKHRINIRNSNYHLSAIPNYNGLNKEAARRFIKNENESVKRAITYLSTKPEKVPVNLQGKFTTKYKNLNNNLIVKHLNMNHYSHNINAKTNLSLFKKI